MHDVFFGSPDGTDAISSAGRLEAPEDCEFAGLKSRRRDGAVMRPARRNWDQRLDFLMHDVFALASHRDRQDTWSRSDRPRSQG